MGYIPKNYPVFPVAPYPGDDANPPVKGNSGIGIRELAALVAMHALISNPKYFSDPSAAIVDAFEIADDFYTEIFR
jgi:hypothetical protein